MLGSWLIASIGTLIAAQTPQRAFATVSIIVAFILPIPIAAILVNEIDAGWTDYAAYLSPLDLVDGLTFWLFQTMPPPSDSLIALTGFNTQTFAAAAVVMGLAASLLLLRRYAKVQA